GALRWYERDLRQERRGDIWQRRVGGQMASAHVRRGKRAEAERWLTDEGAFSSDQVVEMLTAALIAFFVGNWEAAAAAWTTARERHRPSDNRLSGTDYAIWLGRLVHLQGDLHHAEALLQ